MPYISAIRGLFHTDGLTMSKKERGGKKVADCITRLLARKGFYIETLYPYKTNYR